MWPFKLTQYSKLQVCFHSYITYVHGGGVVVGVHNTLDTVGVILYSHNYSRYIPMYMYLGCSGLHGQGLEIKLMYVVHGCVIVVEILPGCWTHFGHVATFTMQVLSYMCSSYCT